MIKRCLIQAVMIIFGILGMNGQIGYQVALINNATGEPRAWETVTVEISITDKEGKNIYSGTLSETTNDFGILSLSVGDGNTFKKMDWSKLPLYISAKVDGILIGKTQILSVPVAEYARTTGELSVEDLCKGSFSYTYGTLETSYHDNKLNFNENGTGVYETKYFESGKMKSSDTTSFRWYADANSITIVYDGNRGYLIKYIPEREALLLDEMLFIR